MKNEKPYNIVILSEILHKKPIKIKNTILDENNNIQIMIDKNNNLNTPVKANTKIYKPYSARITSKQHTNIINTTKKDSAMKINRDTKELKKGLSISQKNKLFYESEKYKDLSKSLFMRIF